MKLRALLVLAGFALAGTVHAQTFYSVSGTTLRSHEASAPGTNRTTVPITGLTAGDVIVGIDRRPANDTIIALTNNAGVGRLYTLNLSSGAASLLSTLAADPTDTTLPYAGLTGTSFGVDFNPVPDRLRVVSDAAQNLRINVDTGATITDTALNGTTTLQGSGYTSAFPRASSTTLFGIDGTSDQLFTTAAPNDGTYTVRGPLGVDAATLLSFDILSSQSPVDDAAYAALTVGGVTGLYRISLTSGAATLIGTIGDGSPVQGIAFIQGGFGGANVPTLGISGLVLLMLALGGFALFAMRSSR